MSAIVVNPRIIRWARERAGLDVPVLEKTFPKYPRWESGDAMPTLRQLENLARRTFTPLGYFFLPEPPEEKLPVPDFRTVKDKGVKRPSPNLLETIQTMQRRQDWLREYLEEEGHPPLSYVGSVTLSDNPLLVAGRIRETLGLTPGWAREYATWTEALRGLRRAVESAGIVVVINGVVGNSTRRTLDPEEFRGFVLPDRLAPLVFINGADAKAAQMFTLAHELGHLWLGQGGVFNLEALQPANSEMELWCNRVAAEFLAPEAAFRDAWAGVDRVEEPFQYLARRFKVSPLVAARRALDLRLITRNEFFAFYHRYLEDERRREKRRPAGGDFYQTQETRIGRRFGELVVRAAREGKLLYQEAYRLTGLHGATFDKYAEGLKKGFLP